MEYPVFAPPIELAEKQPREWSKAEAEAYFKWFLANFDSRVNGVLDFLKLNDQDPPNILLFNAQEKLEELLLNEQFVTSLPAGRKLTNKGYAVAADLGLLVARLLLEHGQGKVAWNILKKPKTDQSYNLPILIGFGEIHFDPIAWSIGDASWLAQGNKKHGAWVKGFEFLMGKI
uniref:hypothetical protein n=1 Tax=Methylomonas sp. PHL2-19 TaxID=3438878 RepID=UPI00402BD281